METVKRLVANTLCGGFTPMSFYDDEDKKDSSKKGKPPVLTNRDEGAAAWLNTDKNGNVYVSVSLPLGLGTLNLFPNNDPGNDDYRNGEAFNKLQEHLDQQ